MLGWYCGAGNKKPNAYAKKLCELDDLKFEFDRGKAAGIKQAKFEAIFAKSYYNV